MRLSERALLAGLALSLLVFSAVAEAQVFEGRAAMGGSWQGELGFYLPFVLFALVSTYHWLGWARRHKRQALVILLATVGVMSLFGSAAAGAPRPTGRIINSFTIEQFTPTLPQQTQNPVAGVDRHILALKESLQGIKQALDATPFLSTGFNAIILIATAAAIVFFILKIRREGRIVTAGPIIETPAEETEPSLPREKVIYAYRTATKSLRHHGLPIPDSDTPTDAHVRVSRFQPEAGDAFWKLAQLYEEAKFSLHPILEQHAEMAASYRLSISRDSARGIAK